MVIKAPRRLLCSLAIVALGFYMSIETAQADLSELQAWMDAEVASGAALSISAAAITDGKHQSLAAGSLLADSPAPPGPDSQYQIGSISKVFTNLLLAEMVALGKVKYSSTLGDLLDEAVDFDNPEVADITLLQLATHTSGLPRLPANLAPTDPLDPYAGYDEAALLQAISNTRALQPLRQQYAYSNFGVGLLGYLLGEVHGTDYAGALDELIIKPLMLERTSLQTSGKVAQGYRGGTVVPNWGLDILDGAGSLWSSRDDMMRLAKIQLGALDYPLKHNKYADFEQVADADGLAVSRVWHLADSADGTIYWHNGGTGGFWSFFGFQPESGKALVILVSGDNDPTNAGLAWFGQRPYEQQADAIDEQTLGHYELSPEIGIGVFERQGMLLGQLSGQSPLVLEAVSDDWYAITVADASVRFVRNGDMIVALELVQNGVVQTAQKVSNRARTSDRVEIDLPESELAAFIGTYALTPEAQFVVRQGSKSLEVQLTGQPFFPVYPEGNDVFFYKIVDAQLHFERDGSGQVIAVVLHQGGMKQRAQRLE